VGYDTFPVPGREVLANDFRMVLGSASAICATGLARLENQVRFAGIVGKDYWGEFCLNVLRAERVDVSAVRTITGMKTGVTVSISNACDRALITFPGTITALRASDISNGLLQSADHLHISSYFLQAGLRGGCRDLLERARQLGLTSSLDPGCDPTEQWNPKVLELLPLVDLFLPNEVELAALTKKHDVADALRVLDNGHTITVAKLGPRGAATRVSGQVISQPALNIRCVDTTGAGDSFNAGFLHMWLQRAPVADALLFACACGALSTQAPGGIAGQPSLDQVQAFLVQSRAASPGPSMDRREAHPDWRDCFPGRRRQ